VPEQTGDIEQQVERIILASFAQPGDEQEPNAQDETEEKRVIDVDLYRLEGGVVVLVPNNGTNPLDMNAVESVAPPPPPVTKTPTIPLTDEVQEQEELSLDTQPEPVLTGTRRRVKPSLILVPLVLLVILAAGAATYLFVLPLEATATVTITPQAQSLQKDVTFTIASNPKVGQVRGRQLEAISLTKTKTVPATGHASNPATRATGIITFYNADSQAHTIPIGVTFTAPDGATIVTDSAVTVQAAVLPEVGIAITAAHVIQAGSNGNIAAHTIYTRCCGSEFITATNTSAFTGGQDARSYSFIESSDIQNAATDLLASLTPQATAALQKQARTSEQLVTPLCSPRTQESAEPGAAAPDVTVSVTQSCKALAYSLDSLDQVATSSLAQSLNLANYQQEGTTQVTVNAATYASHTARLHVSLSGVWVYHFSTEQLTHLKALIAGKNRARAYALLTTVAGIQQVSIHLQRFDFKDLLPTDPQRINVQFFYLVP
jgi:hypothetical protein